MINYYETKSQPITRVMVWQAYKEVKSHAGSGGIDKMSWEYLQKNASTELYMLWNRLSSGSYFPKAVKQVAIPKKGGGERLLGIPTILDRIAQQVVRKHLERILEPKFHLSSFGYRPKRSCHQAVEQANANSFNHDFVQRHLQHGYRISRRMVGLDEKRAHTRGDGNGLLYPVQDYESIDQRRR